MDKLIHPLQKWIPYKLTHTNNETLCHWLNSFDKRFTEPFFDETITICKGLMHRYPPMASVSDLGVLTDWVQGLNCVAPTAFIFHVSRCGSTLVSQLLGMSEQNIALAEVPFFDDILRLPYKNANFNDQAVEGLFKAALKFYGQKRGGHETNLFVKADSWHILFYKQLRALYPNVPFILLYRRPEEVLNSHTKQRGIQAVPGLIEPQLFGFAPQEVAGMSLDQYTAKVLERYFSLYLEVAENDKLSLLLNYNEGIMPMIQKIAAFSKIRISETDLLKMEERSGYHSKHPDKVFAEEQPRHVPDFLEEAMRLYGMVEGKRVCG